MEHSHIVGGSSADQRMHCPGSLAAEVESMLVNLRAWPPLPDKYKPVVEQHMEAVRQGGEEAIRKALTFLSSLGGKDEGSTYANEGRMLHHVMQLCLLEDKKPQGFIGQEFTFGGEKFIFDEELCATKAMPALDAFDELYGTLEGDVQFIEEVRLNLGALIEGAFGTTDALIVGFRTGKKVLVIVDWKFGTGIVVGARGNYQMAFYTLAAIYDPRFAELLDGVEEYLFAIIQPGNTPVLDTWVASERWMRMFEATLVVAIQDAWKKNPPRSPGLWCRFCRAQLECDKFKGLVWEALTKEPSKMTSLEISWWMDRLDLLDYFKNQLRDYAKAVLEGGGNIPRFGLKAKRANRKFKDEAQAERIFRKLFGDDAYKKKLLSPAQAETQLKLMVTRGDVSKEKAKRIKETVLEKLTFKESSGNVVVRDSEIKEPVVGVGPMMQAALGKVYQDALKREKDKGAA